MLNRRLCRRCAQIAVTALAATAASAAAAEGPTPFVIQLFTSQGCSSCPPADRLLSRMAKVPQILALSLSIDYWDYMGWKDTLARPEFDTLQKRYAAARGDNHVYTPQAVIDGLLHVVGSNEKDIASAARAAYKNSGALTVSLSLQRVAGRTLVRVGPAKNETAKSGLLWLVRIAKQKTVKVSEGENKGRTLSYTNVVRSISPFGVWNGASTTLDLPPPDLDGDANAYAVILQAGTEMRPGVILAEAKSDGL